MSQPEMLHKHQQYNYSVCTKTAKCGAIIFPISYNGYYSEGLLI